jgi:4-hydroxy-3-polyprenylbenzoate decarboxylase
MYRDLREFIGLVEEMGLVRHVHGADPYLEIGAITEVAAARPESPMLLFDAISGYPRGFRVLTNATFNIRMAALALGLDPSLSPLEALRAWKTKSGRITPLRPTVVKSAAFLENAMRGSEIDLDRFPVPHWREHDGGPYLGTAALVVTRDPNNEWTNTAIYRVQKHGKNRLTVQFDHRGRHGLMIAQKYWDVGKLCPIAIAVGEDPALFFSAIEPVPEGKTEYENAGGLKGAPIEVFPGPATGILVPAHCEIVLEGMLLPPSQQTLMEGPIGEFTGYYAGEAKPCPVVELTAVHYRNDPILYGAPPLKPPRGAHFGPFRAARLWNVLDAAGISDVTGVWPHLSSLMIVVALKQRYAGHAKRAGLVAAANAYMGRLVVVVDDDIDPSSLDDVMWAVATRCEASESIDIVRNAWSSHLDPRIHPDEKERGVTTHSKLIIEACRPFAWKDRFPLPTAMSPEAARKTSEKWQHALSGGDNKPNAGIA